MKPAQTLENLIDKFRNLNTSKMNESNTRLLFIDDILENVLGWPRETFNPEEYSRGLPEEDDKRKKKWLDYHLRQGDTLRLVVEAKRAGKVFSLPAKRNERRVSLESLLKHRGREVKAVLHQARKYCISVGTYGYVVTNGIQWMKVDPILWTKPRAT